MKNKATSNIKIHQILCSNGLNNVGIYVQDGPFESDIGIVNLRPTKGTRCVCYINENYFDSNGVACPKKLSRYIIKRNDHCSYSEHKIQRLTDKRDSSCASYCLHILYLTKVLGIDFKSDAIINSYFS